jgi:hypothetical protein
MSEKGKYSVTITMRSGDRVLTEVIYPEQGYDDFVGVQAVIAHALIGAGFVNAEAKGTPVPDQVKAMLAGKS